MSYVFVFGLTLMLGGLGVLPDIWSVQWWVTIVGIALLSLPVNQLARFLREKERSE